MFQIYVFRFQFAEPAVHHVAHADDPYQPVVFNQWQVADSWELMGSRTSPGVFFREQVITSRAITSSTRSSVTYEPCRVTHFAMSRSDTMPKMTP